MAQAAAAQANGILQQSERHQAHNGSSYYEYQMSSNGHHHRTEAARGDYARNGEIVAAATGQISTQLTTGTSTPALVAQALSGRYMHLRVTMVRIF